MAIDTSIYSRVGQGGDIDQFAQSMAAVQAARNARAQNKLAQMQLDAETKKQGDAEAVNKLWQAAVGADGAVDRSKFITGLAQGGYGSMIPGYQQQFATMDKSQSELKSAQYKQASELLGLQKTLSTSVMANPTQDSALAALDRMEAFAGKGAMDGERQAVLSLGGDPNKIKAWAAGHALDADKLLPQFKMEDFGGNKQSLGLDPLTGQPIVGGAPIAKTPTIGETEAARHNKVVEQNSQEANDIRKQALSALGGGTGKPLTEGQGNAALFGARAEEADKIIGSLEGKYSRTGLAAKQGVEGVPVLGSVANALSSAEQQQVDQAQRNFINAVLRKESGASISPGEFENARKQYFPQAGDDDKVVAQKAANRATAIRGLKVQAGPGAAQMDGGGNAAQDLAIKFLGFE